MKTRAWPSSIRDWECFFERCLVGAAVSALFQSGRWAQLNRRFERNPALLGSGDKAKLVRMLALIPTGVNGVKTWTVRGRGSQRRSRPLDPEEGARGHSVVAFNAEKRPQRRKAAAPSSSSSFSSSSSPSPSRLVRSWKWGMPSESGHFSQRLGEHQASKCLDTFSGGNHWKILESSTPYSIYISSLRKRRSLYRSVSIESAWYIVEIYFAFWTVSLFRQWSLED